MIARPISVYINWSAYDELSDAVELTEELAMGQLQHLLRLRAAGCRFDYYLMDAFWFAESSGYRAWRKPHWPDGPDRWLDGCLNNGVKPGLWVATNQCAPFCKVGVHPAWENSLDRGRGTCCMFAGGFLAHFMESLHLWYERGVRIYKFDFAHLGAATSAIEQTMLPSEIREANILALSAALKAFRVAHPEVVLIAYNGFEEGPHQSNTSIAPRKFIDTGWLEVFDSLYCGDPRPADVPAMNFWRSKDIYSDHMVRLYEQNGFPLNRIDNAGPMIGVTGTCYHRGTAAWKGMALLGLARGGWVNTFYGNLDLLDEQKAAFLAKAQGLFMPLQQSGRVRSFGGMPAAGDAPYAFTASSTDGALLAVVNPSQKVAQLALPAAAAEPALAGGRPMRVLFHDEGFVPSIADGVISLGPEQLALVGVGRYADEAHGLGVGEGIRIPRSIEPVNAMFGADGPKAIVAKVQAPRGGGGALRVIFRQMDAGGQAKRSSGGAPPKGTTMGKLLRITVREGGRELPVEITYDKAIWSGLSWAAGEVTERDLRGAAMLEIRCSTEERAKVALSGELYLVRY